MSKGSETAYAKLNLALHVRGRRSDGYHDIETIFAFCEDGDTVEAETEEAEQSGMSLAVDGTFSAALKGHSDNLVERAWGALAARAEGKWQTRLRLRKQLPVASGLGGGSADAAATLRLLDRLWGLGVDGQIEEIGSTLGADVPACVRSVPTRGTGKGDELQPLDLGLGGAPVLLVNPRVELPTAEVFERWDGIDRGPLGDDWLHGRNDLEEAAMSLVPQIRSVVAWLSAHRGVELVRMSGSGATCFALFDSEVQCQRVADAVPREWWRMATRLR